MTIVFCRQKYSLNALDYQKCQCTAVAAYFWTIPQIYWTLGSHPGRSGLRQRGYQAIVENQISHIESDKIFLSGKR